MMLNMYLPSVKQQFVRIRFMIYNILLVYCIAFKRLQYLNSTIIGT